MAKYHNSNNLILGLNSYLIQVYYFHLHQSGHGSFEWMKQMKHFKKKVICLSCGDGFFVVITEDNKVHSWGKNDCGQLGISTTGNFIAKPKEVKILNDSKIKIGNLFIF